MEDALITDVVSAFGQNVSSLAKMNVFLQTWSPTIRQLPLAKQKMLKLVKKYNVTFGVIKLSITMKKKFPIWYHIGATEPMRRLNNMAESRCLRDNH